MVAGYEDGYEVGRELGPVVFLSGDREGLAAPSLLLAWEYALTVDDVAGAAEVEAQVRAIESQTGRPYPDFMYVSPDVELLPAPRSHFID
jgi:hypothetical protein